MAHENAIVVGANKSRAELSLRTTLDTHLKKLVDLCRPPTRRNLADMCMISANMDYRRRRPFDHRCLRQLGYEAHRSEAPRRSAPHGDATSSPETGQPIEELQSCLARTDANREATKSACSKAEPRNLHVAKQSRAVGMRQRVVIPSRAQQQPLPLALTQICPERE